MNCCDEFGNCRQGRDCPVRKQPQCKWCHGLGFDASGQRCTCQPDHFGDTLAWILGGFIVVMIVLMAIHAWLR